MWWQRAIVAGALAGLGCFATLTVFHLGAGDFIALPMARDLLAGRNPYGHTPGPYWVPYPMPAVLLAVPFTWLPDSVAAAVWFGSSTFALAWGMLRQGEAWRMGMLFSFPFLYAMLFAQWSPLLAAVWFAPGLAPIILCKPNTAAPLVLSSPVSERSVWIAGAWLVVSFAAHPTWLMEWLVQLGHYQGLRPPILTPLGPLVLTLLAVVRDRRARLVLLMACAPQRVFYDQLALLLVTETPAELFTLVACSWVSFAVLWLSPGMYAMPAGGWSTWLMLDHYLPAVTVILRKDLSRCLKLLPL